MGIFPEIWKKSFITPIHKSGDKVNVWNYRPISKLSAIPKIFESIITKKLSLLVSQQLVNNQHGFRQKKSILTNLILYQNKIISAFEHGQQVDSIYTDFQKAFVKVNHLLLAAKLEHFGFNG